MRITETGRRVGAGLMALACAAVVMNWTLSARPARAAKTTAAALVGPVGILRGQTARLTVLSTAALGGVNHTVDLKFLVRGDNTWQVVQRSFNLSSNAPAAGLELRVAQGGAVTLVRTPNGVLFTDPDQGGNGIETVSLGSLPEGIRSLDICGHEITHGVSEIKATSAFAIIETATGNNIQTVPMPHSAARY